MVVASTRGSMPKSDTWGGSNSGVECQLPKLDVAGSNPVSRSTQHGCPVSQQYLNRLPPQAPIPSCSGGSLPLSRALHDHASLTSTPGIATCPPTINETNQIQL